MRSKAPLALIEQLIMVLVFALAAALCLQAFAAADGLSGEKELRDRALTEGQSMAELTKACSGDLARAAGLYGGTWDGTSWICLFDGDWNQTETETEAACLLEVTPQPGEDGLGLAQVDARVPGGEEPIFSFPVSWQEEVTGLG